MSALNQPLTYEDAYAATNPASSEEEREAAAQRILLGARANQMYWDSRSELESLKARAEGHGVVVRAEEETPTGLDTGTATSGEVVEGTAEEEPATAIGPGPEPNAAETPPPASAEASTSDLDKLREQLRNAGQTPVV